MLIVAERMELSWRSVAFAFAPEFLPQRAVDSKKFGGNSDRKDNPST
ncbi:MAG TPA: hypothetical protein VGI33_14870 [Paenibacillus sp.]